MASIEQYAIAPVAVIIVVYILGSLMFGKLNAKFRCFSIILSAVLAFAVTMLVKANISTEAVFSGVVLTLKNSGVTEIAELAEQLMPVGETLLSVLGAIIGPILFLVLFIVFSIITWVYTIY